MQHCCTPMELPERIACVCAVAFMGAACGDAATNDPLVCDRPLTYVKSPGPALEGTGWHRIYIQGGSAIPDENGQYGMTENRGEVLSSDHFLLNAGSLAEWVYPIVDRLEGHVFLHMARVNDPGVVALYELALVHDGVEVPLLDVEDDADGVMGYMPFERCFFAGSVDLAPVAGDHLLLRVINLTGGTLGVVTQTPDYFTWIDIEAE